MVSADRTTRRRPFTSWVKRLTNLKSSDAPGAKKSNTAATTKTKKTVAPQKNNPYPESGHLHRPSDTGSTNGRSSYSRPASRSQNGSYASIPTNAGIRGDSNKSAAGTVATNPETIHSEAGQSKALTATTAGGALSSMDGQGANSTFSSPNQSVRSLATTLTTMQSTSPGNALNQQTVQPLPNQPHSGLAPPGGSQFSHQYPISPTPASALPAHLAPTGNPTTYSSATANNLLSDDASILTLASSSKRRRRRSMDTDASVRALAPSSVWGGSRESLPLSVLSGNVEHGLHAHSQTRPSMNAMASTERASVYSNHSVAAPALTSERNSYYATSLKQSHKDRDRDARSIDGRSIHRDGGDGKSQLDGKSLYGGESLKGYEGSMRSGALGHGRNDSVPSGNGSPLVSPTYVRGLGPGPASRRNSDWNTEVEEEESTH